ncbi:MAG: hypothetical protein KKE59_01825, partial [Proteobacteria bacterium]|nr:hypothetical protein [Pseudomonadota bacterium]
MRKRIKLYLLTAVLVAAGYFLLSYHIIYFGNTIKLIHKSNLTSEYTFIWAKNQSMESILRIDTLREAGLGDVLVEMGKLSKEEKDFLEQKFNS